MHTYRAGSLRTSPPSCCPRSRGNSITVTPSDKDDTTRVIHNLGASSGVCLIRLDSQGNNMPSNISV